MKTKVFQSLDQEVADLLKQGKVGVCPSDTIYGLFCDAKNKKAVKQLYDLKKREKKPGTIIAANVDQLVELGLKKRYLSVVKDLWPNPLSVVIPTVDLEYLHEGVGGLAMRIPKDNALREFLEKTGAVMTSSANFNGGKPADTVQEAFDYFGDSVDFYVDGGDLSKNKPSTIIRTVDDEIEILREGAISEQELLKIRKSTP
ncbi:MAG: L-threonylcarbamoyladenylate synthase [bacterium]|nr:L-threonylcarbamoyladenylate synthase [bacterium]